MLNGLKMSVWL